MKQLTAIEPNVDLVEIGGKKIYLVGTAHVSKASADLVESVIRRYHPTTVCIELCESRFKTIKNPEIWKNTDLFEVIKSGKAYVLMAQLALASFQKRLAKEFGVKPGEEMHRAISLAEEIGAEIYLVDRDVKTTLKRAWSKASFWSLWGIIISLVASAFSKNDITEDEIEKLKNTDALTAMMGEFSDRLPGVKTALIDERDNYMASKIAEAPGETIVAVLGAGHIPGMSKVFGDKIDRQALEVIPPPSLGIKIVSWGIPALILLIFALGVIYSDTATGIEMLKIWVVVNGSLSALGALIALAHPLTVLTAFVAAPITSLNPTIAAGWFAGLSEALLRKPRVKDLETVADDISSVRGLWRNRVTKILLVMVFANLGSMAGTFIAAKLMTDLLV